MQNLRYYCRQKIGDLEDKQRKFDYIYRVRLGQIIVQGANKIPYDPLSNLKSYWNKKNLSQRTIIDIFPQHEGNVWILQICESVKVYKLIIF